MQFWRKCTMDRRVGKQSCILDQVTDIKTFWTWADLHFLPEIFTPEAKYSNEIATVRLMLLLLITS